MAFFGAFWALYFTIQVPALRTESAYIGDRYSYCGIKWPKIRVRIGPERTGTAFRFFFLNRNGVPVHYFEL